jgi:hypothetical protein
MADSTAKDAPRRRCPGPSGDFHLTILLSLL